MLGVMMGRSRVSILGRLTKTTNNTGEARALTETAWMKGAIWGDPTSSGKTVEVSDALTITAVYACVRVIAETLGSVPFQSYKRLPQGKGKELDAAYHLNDVLHIRPNPEMIAMEFREFLTASALLRGNGYAEIIYDNVGRVRELWPLMGSQMEVFRDREDGKIKYLYQLPSGEKRALRWDQVFHLRN